MTEQTGGQPPAGWYPDGSGQVRYWDGSAWTEHVQPQQPEVAAPEPIAPSTPETPAATAAPAGAAGAGAGAAAASSYGGGGYDGGGYDTPAADQPFYKKPVVIACAAVALLLIIGGAAFALSNSSSDDDTGTVATPQVPATSAPAVVPTTATQTYQLYCQPSTFPVDTYPFAITMTVTPTEISVSSVGSIRNTGPTTIEPGKYRFEAAVTVNGTPLELIGPKNTVKAAGDTGGKQPVFVAADMPLVAKAAPPAGVTGTPTVILTDLYFNNIDNAPTGSDALGDTFDARCNTSPQPNTAPTSIGLSVPPGAAGSAVVPSVPSSVAPSVASSVTP